MLYGVMVKSLTMDHIDNCGVSCYITVSISHKNFPKNMQAVLA